MFDSRTVGTLLLGIGILILGYGLYISFSLTEQVVEGVSGHYVDPLHKAAIVIGGAIMTMVGWLLMLPGRRGN